MIETIRRQRAAQAAVDRFKGVPFRFGRNDCIRMGALVLRKMGHKPMLAKAGSYNSALSAARALKRSGHATIADALDAMGLERIAPAAAWVADLVMLPEAGPFGGALTVAVGNGRVLGYHEDCIGAEILQPIDFVAAWRV